MANLSVGHFVIIGFVLSLCHDCRRWCWWAWWLQKAFKDNDNDNDNDNIRFDKTHFYTTTVNNWHKWQMGQSKNQKRHVTTTIGQRQQNILTSTQICSKFLKNNIFCHLGLSKKPSWSKPLRSEYLKAVCEFCLLFFQDKKTRESSDESWIPWSSWRAFLHLLFSCTSSQALAVRVDLSGLRGGCGSECHCRSHCSCCWTSCVCWWTSRKMPRGMSKRNVASREEGEPFPNPQR